MANLGDGIFQVAVALVAVRLTRSPILISGVALAARLPWLFLALPAGAWADRLDRRLTMVRMNALAADVASIALVYVVALGLGCAEVLFDTAAQTLMPALVEKDHLSRANGRLYAVELTTNQFIGPPLGGALVAMSATLAIGSSAGLYAVALAALMLLRGNYRTARVGPPTRLRADIAEGLRYLFGHRLLRTLGVLLGLQNLLFAAQGAIFVLFAVSNDGLGLSDFGVGVLFTMGAIGGLVGSFIAARVERWIGRASVLRLCVLVGGFSLALPGLFPNVIVAGACGLATGTIMMWNVVTVSLRQRIIPDHLLGRVNSGYRLLGWGTMPIGSGLGGVVAEWFGVRTVFVAAGIGTLALLVPLFLIVTDRAIHESERGSDEGDDLGARRPVADGENGDARLLGEGRAPGIDPEHTVDLLD
jgi:MFS family permease